MQIVIDIPKAAFDLLQDTGVDWLGAVHILDAVANGILLPEGHGNIYDENDIKKGLENPYQRQTVLNSLNSIKPIIEADKE